MAHFIKRIFPFFKIDFIFHVKQKKLNIFVIYLTNFGQDTTCVLSAIDINICHVKPRNSLTNIKLVQHLLILWMIIVVE